MKYVCYGWNICVLLQFNIDILLPNGMVSRGKSFVGKLTKSWEWNPQEWNENTHERGPRKFLISITWQYKNFILQRKSVLTEARLWWHSDLEPPAPEINMYCYRGYNTLSERPEWIRPCNNTTFFLEKKNLGKNMEISEHSPQTAAKWHLKTLQKFRCMGYLVWARHNDSFTKNRMRKRKDRNGKGKTWELSPQGGDQGYSHQWCCKWSRNPKLTWWKVHLTFMVFSSESWNVILS